jgi:hypothetical protein
MCFLRIARVLLEHTCEIRAVKFLANSRRDTNSQMPMSDAMTRSAAESDSGRAGHGGLGMTQRYMRMSPRAFDSAIRRLDQPSAWQNLETWGSGTVPDGWKDQWLERLDWR